RTSPGSDASPSPYPPSPCPPRAVAAAPRPEHASRAAVPAQTRSHLPNNPADTARTWRAEAVRVGVRGAVGPENTTRQQTPRDVRRLDMPISVAFVETEHFSFHGLGDTPHQAVDAVMRAWAQHA